MTVIKHWYDSNSNKFKRTLTFAGWFEILHRTHFCDDYCNIHRCSLNTFSINGMNCK
jgi:hypothetical protein